MSLRVRAACFLLAVAVVAAIGASYFARGVPLQSNLLAMLPPTERDAEVEQVIARLGTVLAGRVVFVVSQSDAAAARRSAEALGDALKAGGALRTLLVRLPAMDPSAPAQLYASGRFGLLTDEDRAVLAGGDFNVREAALRQLVVPLPHGIALPAAQDPFGFFGRWIAAREPKAGQVRLEDGYLIARERGRVRVLLVGEVAGDVYDQTVQERVVAAYERAASTVRSSDPGVELWRAGTVFYAAQARASAMGDMERIGICAVLGVALLVLAAFRSLRPMLLGLLSAAIGILFAAVATLRLDGELHLISLAFGASLIGEAVDYSILLFAAHLAAGSSWTPERGIALVRPGLTVAVGTSLLAYALLALLPFPASRRCARFALIGLAVSYLSVLWLLPAFLPRPRRGSGRRDGWAAPARSMERAAHQAGDYRRRLVVLCLHSGLARGQAERRRAAARAAPARARAAGRGDPARTGFECGHALFPRARRRAEKVLAARGRADAAPARARAPARCRAPGGQRLRAAARAQEANRRAGAKSKCSANRVLARTLIDAASARGGKAAARRFRRGAKPVTVPTGSPRRSRRLSAISGRRPAMRCRRAS